MLGVSGIPKAPTSGKGSECWAVITGATDGIGLEYAKQLSSKGYSLLLIARNESKLREVSQSIQEKKSPSKANTEIRIHVADFSNLDIYDGIAESLKALPGTIHVLVNNVGISYEYCEYFTDIPDQTERITAIINVNMVSCVRMCALVLPRMVTQGKGAIINVSSLSAAYPTPLLALYGASKTFVDFFSRSLSVEYSGKGVFIQSVLPAYVVSKMSKIRRPSMLVPTARDYVHSALGTVGVENRTYGYWSHKVQGYVQDHLIAGLLGPDFMAKIAYGSLQGVRKSYYRKFGLKEKAQ